MLYTAERANEKSTSDNPVIQRHIIAYESVLPYINGDVLEVGVGEGYGAQLLKKNANSYTGIDKFEALNKDNLTDIKFIQMTIPPFTGLTDNSFDVVVSFQVIEHIEDDSLFIKEIFRVLKPGGKFICTTPNIKMSITRNPYHIREYTVEQLQNLMQKTFNNVEMLGVFGDEKFMDYHNKNRESVKRITRFDIFNLQYRLPRSFLKIPYDIANRLNRLRLQKENTSLVSDITSKNFFIAKANDTCLDLFVVSTK